LITLEAVSTLKAEQTCAMAPALIEEVVTEQTTVGYKSGVGQYKEAAFGGPKVFQKELELRGTDKHAPAKYPHYLPTWDNEKGGK
jgi:sulfonate dioxygenase